MGLHGLRNKTHRNSFDQSERNLFTAKIGELLPCFVQELNPGDSINVDSSYFTRTAPLSTAAFTRLRENVQFFFVPYSCLWKYFEQQVTNMTKMSSGADPGMIATDIDSTQSVTTQMPYVNYASLHKYLIDQIKAAAGPNPVGYLNHGEYRWSATAKLLQLLGYGNFVMEMDKTPDADCKNYFESNKAKMPNLSVFPLLAYQKIINDHYKYRQWQPYEAWTCNIDYLVPSSSSALDLSTKVESFVKDGKAPQLRNFLDLGFSNMPLDYFNGVLPAAQYGNESVVSLGDGTTASGLLKGKLTLQDITNDNTGRLGIRMYEKGSAGDDVPMAADETFVSKEVDTKKYDGVLLAGRAKSNTSQFAYVTTMVGRDSEFELSSGSASSSAVLSILALRQATAMQRYKEIQMANDVDFVSQIQAHFGVKPHTVQERSQFLGGASSNIDINPIVNNNLQGNGIASVGAAPTGSGHGRFKYTANTYGVVMGIYRCTPILDYAHIGIDRKLFKTDASDFVIPELDSIGMQQNYLTEIYAPSPDDAQNWSQIDVTKTYGFAPRYAEYKTNFDKFNGAFCTTLSHWVAGLSQELLQDVLEEIYDPREDNVTIALKLMECRPDIVKSIFVDMDTKLVTDDVLYVGMFNQVFSNRQLSVYGLPYSN